ncbi:MAG: hypothetical protein JNM24_07890 [Bdellovibrionaceae bacterium]|jgi:hypothetical protein|nr:hypothetical protein [Pseudobdellovibrionaceae bacterium]
MKQIYFAKNDSTGEIENLRRQEYAKASGYTLNLNTLRWSASDSQSFVMVAKDGDTIISTMRGEIITDASLMEKKLECPWDFPLALQLPTLLLSRAATAKSYQSQGLNLILRYQFLKMAQHYQIPMVIGTFVSGSPRQNTLLAMGYQFFENTLGWQQSTYRSHRPVIVAVLDMKTHGEQALNYCLEKLGAQPKYELTESYPELRYVRNL